MSKTTDSVNGTYIVVMCPECSGTGKVTVYNAYDPDYTEEDECPSCFGTGRVSKRVHFEHKPWQSDYGFDN